MATEEEREKNRYVHFKFKLFWAAIFLSMLFIVYVRQFGSIASYVRVRCIRFELQLYTFSPPNVRSSVS